MGRVLKKTGCFCVLLLMLLALPMSASAAKARLNKTKATLNVGKSCQLKLKNNKKKVKWSSSAPGKVRVSAKGKVTALKKGTATITAKAGKKKYKCKITVKQPVKSVTMKLTEKELTVGRSVTLKAVVSPSNANNKTLKWKSGNTKIATVSAKGKVKAKQAGTVTITATAKDGSKKKATCKITVVPKPETEQETEPPVPVKQPSERALKYLQILQKYSDQLEKDAAAGFLWGYDAYYGETTWESERAKAKKRSVEVTVTQEVKDPVTGEVQIDPKTNKPVTEKVKVKKMIGYTNCALLMRWALKDDSLKLLAPGESFWSKWSNGKAYFYFNGALQKNMAQFNENFEILTVDKTPAQLEAEGNLLPGDICGWYGMQHTNVYAGNHLWYEGGRLNGGKYQKIKVGSKKKDVYIFDTFGPVTGVGMKPAKGRKIHQIIRIK